MKPRHSKDPAVMAAALTEKQRDCLLFFGKGYFAKATIRSLYQRGLLAKGAVTELGYACIALLKESRP